jgi:DNA gyrase/topoisomerase IV subunit A
MIDEEIWFRRRIWSEEDLENWNDIKLTINLNEDEPREVIDEMFEKYFRLRPYVILERAVGNWRRFKPVQRRFLHALKGRRAFQQSANVIGSTMYHPHGDVLLLVMPL